MSGRHSRAAARARAGARSDRASRDSGDRASLGGLGRPSAVAFADGSQAIFREEALASHASGAARPDAEIWLGQPWLRWLYLVALGLVAAGVALTVVARTAQESDGTAIVTEPGGQFAALLPVGVTADLTHVSGLALVLAEPRSRRVTIAGARIQLADPALARQAGLAAPDQPSVLLTGRLAGAQAQQPHGRTITPVALVVRSQAVGAVIVREFEVMLGTRQAGS
jgi:hypothetical protein